MMIRHLSLTGDENLIGQFFSLQTLDQSPGVLVSSFVRLPFFFELCPKVSLRLFDKMKNGFVVNGFSIYPREHQARKPVQLHYKSMCEIVGQAKILQLDHSNKSRSGTLGRAVQAFALYSDQNQKNNFEMFFLLYVLIISFFQLIFSIGKIT